MIWFLVLALLILVVCYFTFQRNNAIYEALTAVVNDSESFSNYYPYLPSYNSLVFFHMNVWTKEDLIELAIKRGAK